MNIQEWKTYVGQLAGTALRSKAIAANTQRFVDALRAEGMTMADVSAIMLAFVRQLAATGQAVPGGGVFDMPTMAEIDPVAMRGPTIDPKAVAEMAANPPEEESLEDRWDEGF